MIKNLYVSFISIWTINIVKRTVRLVSRIESLISEELIKGNNSIYVHYTEMLNSIFNNFNI